MIPILIITGCQAAYLHPSLWRAVLDPLRAWVRSNQLLATRPLRAPMSSRWKHADICLREKKLKKTGSFSAKKHCTKDRMKTGNRLAKIPKPLVKLSLLVFSWLVFQRIFFFLCYNHRYPRKHFTPVGFFLSSQRSILLCHQPFPQCFQASMQLRQSFSRGMPQIPSPPGGFPNSDGKCWNQNESQDMKLNEFLVHSCEMA